MQTVVTQTEKVAAKPSWLRSPQRVWLRRVIFQVHLWLGIVVALYSIVIGLSGSALVFKEQIQHATEPELYRASTAPRTVTLDQMVHRIEADRPGWRVSGLQHFDEGNVPVTALMGRRGAPPTPNYRAVIFDRNSGQILRDRMRFDGVLGWITNLHFYLLAGKPGIMISGWMALGLLILCLSGVVLWWPGVKRWAGALILRLHRNRHRDTLNWKRLNWDMHSVVGFWCSLALLAVSFTGIYFAFPKTVRNITVLATGEDPRKAAAEDEAAPKKPAPSKLPALTVDQAIDAARRALPAEAPAGYFATPYKPGGPFFVTGYYRGALPYSQLIRVTLDPHTGSVLDYSDSTKSSRGLRAVQYFFTVHFGSFGGDGALGIVVRILWVLVGIAPALLAVTGLIMYWNRKLHPMWRRMKA
ncbi:MAG: PepSY-associated TM helix domain-containing protein [Edaphobacter sp.]|uniref:PepSY-associated TM helix domain-containing protein n=1 Tax=Edaphobacter sp. TaxID=1934404 RepID=UPI0023978E40|nr:PepSY-associated TM helix domain-containing protein [Edaphobacter sp.]MDE1178184.1 PepSY-associated TM helix domain-containing protein [Edaphobacter sp.]